MSAVNPVDKFALEMTFSLFLLLFLLLWVDNTIKNDG